jgi:hypothetical protein
MKGTHMRRLLALASLATLAALAATASATAKGPSTASLTGPGLDRALPVKGMGESGPGTPLGSLVQFGGFFGQVFGGSPDPTTRARPAADLGPRYRIVYRVPGPGGTSTIVQDVYPYATPSPLTHMRAGQRFWEGMRTHGGWVVAGARLKAALVEAGLPESPPSSGASSPWTWTGAGAGGAAALVLLVLALRRRRIARFRTVRGTA